MWEVVATEEFEGWFGAQAAATQDRVRYVVRLLMQLGPQLPRPYADTLKGSRFANMKELRVNARGAAVRIAFAFDPLRKAVLLVAGDKRGTDEKRFYRSLIARADASFSAYLER